MTRVMFTAAFLLGASVIVWMGRSFVGIDPIALTVITVIGFVYMVGFIELVQFRSATTSLTGALSALTRQSNLTLTFFGEWLETLHSSLQNSVRLRVEGERVALPAPVLTPYLVGLLVMLGLLGTFAGMVDTLKGAVLALEGTTELQAVRAGLAAPIKGLGLAFGTSVAGVAASAVLGLLSTLSRRDRMLATRVLDSKISTVFRKFSLSYNRQETYKALQNQAQAFPEVVDKLEALTNQMAKMSEHLGDTLTSNQSSFHQAVQGSYSALAEEVGASLKQSLSDSGRLTGEAIKPIIKEAMFDISQEVRAGVKATHDDINQTAKNQLSTISDRLSMLSEDVSKVWAAGLSAHEHSNTNLAAGLKSTFSEFNASFKANAQSVLDSLSLTSSSLLTDNAKSDKERLNLWIDSFHGAQVKTAQVLEGATSKFVSQLEIANKSQQVHFESISQGFETVSSTLTEEWQAAGNATNRQQKQDADALHKTLNEIVDSTASNTKHILSEAATIFKSSEELVTTRVKTEQAWLSEYDQRMEQLVATFVSSFGELRTDEERRGNAAVDRLSELEVMVVKHLSSLGNSLEAPMTRLIETASETPRAAAEVISQLRAEISNNVERDNTLLEERGRIMKGLEALFTDLEQRSKEQFNVVESLVSSSANMLARVGDKFTDHVGSEVGKLAEITDHFSGSAAEMASLGDAFSFSVELFNQSTGSLIENLGRIETSLGSSATRSDEQMDYYLAQAREIIDQSMTTQQALIDQLRNLGRASTVQPIGQEA